MLDVFKKAQRGFTLIELLVVVAIIGVLTALLLPNLVGIRGRASDAKIKGDLSNLKKALRLYYNDFQTYPADSSGVMLGCVDGDNACSPGEEFANGSTIYMGQLPEEFEYEQESSGEGFLIWAELDNASDEDIGESATRCGVGSPEVNAYYVCAD